jgi:centriolar protein POC1
MVAQTNESYLRSQDPTLERSFRGHKDVITGLCFKPSMSQLASSSMDHSVMIWNFKPQLRAFRFVGHKVDIFKGLGSGY